MINEMFHMLNCGFEMIIAYLINEVKDNLYPPGYISCLFCSTMAKCNFRNSDGFTNCITPKFNTITHGKHSITYWVIYLVKD